MLGGADSQRPRPRPRHGAGSATYRNPRDLQAVSVPGQSEPGNSSPNAQTHGYVSPPFASSRWERCVALNDFAVHAR